MVCRETDFLLLHHRSRWIFETYGTQHRGNTGGDRAREDLPRRISENPLCQGPASGWNDGSSSRTFLAGSKILSREILPSSSLGAIKVLNLELLAKVRNLPFDRLRVNGLRLKLFSFSVRGELVEPQKILLQEALFLPLFLFFLFNPAVSAGSAVNEFINS